MALPKLNTVSYDLELPSTGETVKFRPFLVKEQKNLLIAQESEETRSALLKVRADGVEAIKESNKKLADS